LVVSRYRWVVLGVGTAAQASLSAVLLGIAALAPALRDHYELSLGQVGVVLAAVSIGFTLSLLPWGLLADRIGERFVAAAGLIGAAAALAGAAFAPDFGWLVILLVAAGLAGASVNSASGRAVMHWFGADERGLALGIRQASIPIGGAVAAVVLPSLSLRAAFLALAGGCLVTGVASAFLLRERAATTIPESATELARPLRDPRMWRLSSGSGLVLVAQIAMVGFVVLFLHEQRGVSATRAAAVLALIQVLGIGMRIGAGWWSDRLGSRIVPLRRLSLAIAVCVAAAAALVDASLWVLVPALVAAGALGLSWNGLSFTAAAEVAGLARSGAAIGFQQTVLAVVGAATPIAFATLVAATSWRLGFGVAALGPVAGYAVLRRLEEA
jgi:sugar phosphate permease